MSVKSARNGSLTEEIALRVTPEQKAKLGSLAARSGATMSDVLRQFIDQVADIAITLTLSRDVDNGGADCGRSVL